MRFAKKTGPSGTLLFQYHFQCTVRCNTRPVFKHVALRSNTIEIFLFAVRHREEMLTLDAVFKFWVIWRRIESVSLVLATQAPMAKVVAALVRLYTL